MDRRNLCFALPVSLLSVLLQDVSAIFPFVDCRRGDGRIDFTGDAPTRSVIEAWNVIFKSECPGYEVQLGAEDVGADAAARMLCSQNLLEIEDPVEINGMARDWNTEADQVEKENHYTFDCSGSRREATQVVIGHDVIVLAVPRNSSAASCVDSLPGMTFDQVRWVFSSFSDSELADSSKNWNLDSVMNSNNDPDLRTWKELSNDQSCPEVAVGIAGPSSDSGLYDFFQEMIFESESSETFSNARMYHAFGSAAEVMDEITNAGTAIGIFSYDFYTRHRAGLKPIAIKDSTSASDVFGNNYVLPTISYPFSRNLYLNVLKNDALYDRVNPFLEAGFSILGDEALRTLDKVPASLREKYEARAKLDSDFVPHRDAVECGTHDGTVEIAGSSSVDPISSVWAGVYSIYCSGNGVAVTEEGSSDGADLVCDQGLGERNPVDIGTMSRNWAAPLEATSQSTVSAWKLDCSESDRSVIQINIAIDAVTFVFSNNTKVNSTSTTTNGAGGAGACIAALGGRLTKDIIRWIYSNFTDEQLMDDGWNKESAIPNSDGNSETKLWSELSTDAACKDEEIKMTGSDLTYGSDHFLSDWLFNSDNEGFDYDRMISVTGLSYTPASTEHDTINYVLNNGDAIGFVAFSSNYEALGFAGLGVAALDNEGQGGMVFPSMGTLESGVYPLRRRLYMNLYNNEDSLIFTRPFIQFGLSTAGQQLVEQVGFHALSSTEARIMQTRAETESGVPINAIETASHLGCASKGFSIAGSSTVFPIAELWSGVYEVGCDVDIRVSGGGSSAGAGRVCGNLDKGTPVEIGDMSREWETSEATPQEDEPSIYQCLKGDKSRSVIQAEVATDGLTVVVPKGGVAEECIHILGGLTIDQLRWIYSDKSDEELRSDPSWDPASVPNSDKNGLTHLWSELDKRCARQEIQISGADSESGTYEYFSEVLFPKDSGESFDLGRPAPYVNNPVDEALVEYLLDNEAAISYFGYAYFYTRKSYLTPVPIRNAQGDFVLPDEETMGDGRYNPLSRPIYMNLLNDPEWLQHTFPFLQFGYSEEGAKLVGETGYVPVNAGTIFDTLNLVADEAGLDRPPDLTAPPTASPTEPPSVDGDDGLSAGTIAGITVAAVVLFGLLCMCLYVAKTKSKKQHNLGPEQPQRQRDDFLKERETMEDEP